MEALQTGATSCHMCNQQWQDVIYNLTMDNMIVMDMYSITCHEKLQQPYTDCSLHDLQALAAVNVVLDHSGPLPCVAG